MYSFIAFPKSICRFKRWVIVALKFLLGPNLIQSQKETVKWFL
jgi:hypothetical protein